MRSWIEKKSVQAVLVMTVIFIWGYNTYSIVDISKERDEAANSFRGTDIVMNQFEVPEVKRSVYRADFRDPFKIMLTKKVQRRPEKRIQKPVQEINIPSLKLAGIIEEMALIQNQKQKLFFVSTGDTIEGAKVQFITKDSVGLLFKSKKFTLQFNN